MVYPGPFDQAYFEDGSGTAGYTSYAAFQNSPLWTRIADDIEVETGPVSGKDVLDAGAGYGFLAEELRLRGAIVTALDVSAWAVPQGQALHPDLSWLEEDFLVNSLSNNSFDLLVAIGLVDCLLDKTTARSVINEGRMLLRPRPQGSSAYLLASLDSDFYLLLTELDWQTETSRVFNGWTVTVSDLRGPGPALGWDLRVVVVP